MTIKMLPLPAMNHPIWTMGFSAVTVAYSVCNAFLALLPEEAL